MTHMTCSHLTSCFHKTSLKCVTGGHPSYLQYTCVYYVSLRCPAAHLCSDFVTACFTSTRRSKVFAHSYVKNVKTCNISLFIFLFNQVHQCSITQITTPALMMLYLYMLVTDELLFTLQKIYVKIYVPTPPRQKGSSECILNVVHTCSKH